MSPPSTPVIDNPTNEEWVNYNFMLVLHSTDSLSGINHYEYRYANTDWVIYENSATENFTTTPFSRQRNELVYVRACNNAGLCSGEASTYIRIDKTKPVLTFSMKNGNNIVDSTSNEHNKTVLKEIFGDENCGEYGTQFHCYAFEYNADIFYDMSYFRIYRGAGYSGSSNSVSLSGDWPSI